MAKKPKEESDFSKWRKEKRLSIADFAGATRINYMTVARWSSGVNKRPREALREKIKRKYPDCPLVA